MTTRITSLLKLAATLSAVCLVVATSTHARATTYDSSSTGIWSSPATWGGSGPPTGGDNANIHGPNTVTLDTNVSGLNTVYVAFGGGTLDLNGKTFGVNDFHVGGAAGPGVVTRTGGGTVAATSIKVGDGASFTFGAGDTATNFYFESGNGGGTATTAATSNITSYFEMSTTATLNMGANLNVGGGPVYLGGGGSNVNMGGFSVTAGQIIFGSAGPATSDGTGKFFTNNLSVNDGSLAQTKGGTITSGINLNAPGSGGILRVIQSASQLDGLTLDGSTLNFNGGVLNLVFDGSPSGALGANPATFDWAFRWKGNHELALEALIGSNLTSAAPLTTGQVRYIASDDYTYVGFEQAANGVPEPSTLVLAALGLAGLGLLAWRKNGQAIAPVLNARSAAKTVASGLSVTFAAVGLLVATGTSAYGSYSSTVLADNPVGYWRFEDASVANSQTAVNSATSGAVLNGTYINGTGLSQVVNPFAGLGKSLNYDASSATDDGVTVASNALLDFNTKMSMEVWIYHPTGSPIDGNTRILDKNDNPGYILLQGGGNQALSYFQTNFYAASGPLSNDAWHHVVVTFDGSITQSKVYIDGALVNTNNSSPSSIGINTKAFSIGINGSNNPNNEDYHGMLDEAALYGDVLSLAQVQAHFNARNDAEAAPNGVPEPSTFVLAALGLAGLGVLAWRRRK